MIIFECNRFESFLTLPISCRLNNLDLASNLLVMTFILTTNHTWFVLSDFSWAFVSVSDSILLILSFDLLDLLLQVRILHPLNCLERYTSELSIGNSHFLLAYFSTTNCFTIFIICTLVTYKFVTTSKPWIDVWVVHSLAMTLILFDIW